MIAFGGTIDKPWDEMDLPHLRAFGADVGDMIRDSALIDLLLDRRHDGL